MKMNNTKRSLIMSLLSMVLCMSMLIGSTFAWFTDSVTSAGNKVVAGNLDVDLYMWNEKGSTEITNESAPIFGEGALAENSTHTLWEPGKTQVVYLSIKNNGSLDLKYKVAIDVTNPVDGKDLYKAMQYAITPDAQYSTTAPAWTTGNAVVAGENIATTDVQLKSGEEHFFALSVHMREDAGNEYMNGKVEFDISVLAGQLASELDSFNNQYDAQAPYAEGGQGSTTAPEGNESAKEIWVENGDAKVGSVTIPATAVSDSAKNLSANIEAREYDGNITIAAGMEKKSFEVSVEGLKANNDVPVKVKISMPTGLDPDTFKVFHYDQEIDCQYNPTTGYVTFNATEFSPFTIVYDAESKYVAPEVSVGELPTATVTPYTEISNITWGSFGQWSPTKGLEANLETAYTFACLETLAEAKENPYANWYCDFYVKLDRDLGENQIFLGGNYGDFGWVGFHNGTVMPKANEEIALLGSVTNNPWTYVDVVQNVGTFICGVGDVNNALSGAEFTVMLRLTNPADEADFVNVATIKYTFN